MYFNSKTNTFHPDSVAWPENSAHIFSIPDTTDMAVSQYACAPGEDKINFIKLSVFPVGTNIVKRVQFLNPDAVTWGPPESYTSKLEVFLRGKGLLKVASVNKDFVDPGVTETTPYDPVNNPSHYTSGGIECLDAMQAMLSRDEFIGFLRGNIFKYQWRYKHKNGVEDLKKADFYHKRLIEVEQNGLS